MNYHTTLELGTSANTVNTANTETKILSVGSFLPENIVKSDHLFAEINSETKYGIAIDWMSKDMGIIERRMSAIGGDLNPSTQHFIL